MLSGIVIDLVDELVVELETLGLTDPRTTVNTAVRTWNNWLSKLCCFRANEDDFPVYADFYNGL